VSGAENTPDQVIGERSDTSVSRALSVQSRLSSVIALALMAVLGAGSLTWYYASTFTRQSRARQNAVSASASRAQGDSSLPSIGRIDPPPPPPSIESSPLDPPADRQPISAGDPAEIPLASAAETHSGPPQKTAAELTEERELSGAVFIAQSSSEAATVPNATDVIAAPADPSNAPFGSKFSGASGAVGAEPRDLASWLRPSATPAVRAQLLPAQRLLLPKGAFIDCTLETAIDSTLPGMTTCVMATDAFGVDGKVVLLERGTKLMGETRGQIQQGAARIFVLWTEARTPTGVVVPLDSPGADELGRSGLPGEVNRHFWERFGAALLVSIIDGGVQAAADSGRNGNTVIVDPAASQGVTTEVLKGTLAIPPTVVKSNGDRIQVLVARDVDFRSVYELRNVPAGP
jgi:type IV secretion system protein VirB10